MEAWIEDLRCLLDVRDEAAVMSHMAKLLMFAKYSVGAQRAAPAPARHSLCPKTTLYSARLNSSNGEGFNQPSTCKCSPLERLLGCKSLTPSKSLWDFLAGRSRHATVRSHADDSHPLHARIDPHYNPSRPDIETRLNGIDRFGVVFSNPCWTARDG